MSFHLPSRNRQRFPKEEELIKAEGRLREATEPVNDHPSRSQLESFAAGQYPEAEPTVKILWAHLHDCDSCLATMAEIRGGARNEQREPILGSRKLVLAVVAVVLAAICFWAIRARTPLTTIATVDLREITRGNETSSILVKRDSRVIRVLLPRGSPSGTYVVGIFGSTNPWSPLLAGYAQTSVENGDLVVAVSISLKELPPGTYALGIRGDAEWKKYAVTIK